MTDKAPEDALVELVDWLRKVAPRRKQGQSNEFALFDMANLSLWDLNAKINEAADAITTLSSERYLLVETMKIIEGLDDGTKVARAMANIAREARRRLDRLRSLRTAKRGPKASPTPYLSGE